MNDLDRMIVDHVVHDLPFSDTVLRQLGEAGPIGQTALLLGLDESAIETWYDRFRGPHTPLTRVLSRLVDREETVDEIDRTLGEDPSVLADLVRASLTWDHPTLPVLLDRDAYRVGAAWMLCQANQDAVADWLEGARTPDEIADTARVAGIAGCHELFEPFAAWLGPLQDAEDSGRHRLAGGLFLMDPARWSRMYLRGETDANWMADSIAVLDALSVHASSYFAGLLEAVGDDPSTFEFVARIAMAGVAARFAVRPEDDLSPILRALDAEDFGLLLAHPVFVAAAALGDDEHMQITLVESAAHDLLFSHGEDSPGVAGFPLSPTYPTDEEIAAAEELLRGQDTDDPGLYLSILATLADLASLAAASPDRFAPLLEAARGLTNDSHVPIARAAHRLFDRPPARELVATAQNEDIRAYMSAERLARHADEEALLALIELWTERGSLFRVSLYSALAFDVMRHLVANPQD